MGLAAPERVGQDHHVENPAGRRAAVGRARGLRIRCGAGLLRSGPGTVDESAAVLDGAPDAADLTPGEARGILARFLFTGDDVFKRVSALSGGERNRLALAKLMASRPNVLILDEPTNHLDIDSRQALGQALQEFQGTIILTSHDRYLLNSVATRILQISGGAARVFEGNYDVFAEKARALRPRVAQKKKKPAPKKTEHSSQVQGSRLSKTSRKPSKPPKRDRRRWLICLPVPTSTQTTSVPRRLSRNTRSSPAR